MRDDECDVQEHTKPAQESAVKIMLDVSPAKLLSYRERFGFDFYQLRTPLTKYARCPGVPYGLDNGCYERFERKVWERLLDEAESDRPIFVTLPDVVGDAARTVELFHAFKLRTNELPRALVLQDGIQHVRIPWDDLAAVFIGGSDQFKFSREAVNAAKAARMLGKWVHVGRVNAAPRARNWIGLADSLDGSGLSRYDHMLIDVLSEIQGEHPQRGLISEAS